MYPRYATSRHVTGLRSKVDPARTGCEPHCSAAAVFPVADAPCVCIYVCAVCVAVRAVVRVVHQAGTNLGSICGGGREGYLVEREAHGGKGEV